MQQVKLLYNSPLKLAIYGARICYNSFDKSDTKPCTECVGIGKAVYFSVVEEIAVKCSTCGGEGYIYGEEDLKLIERLRNDGHHSVFEHIYYTFEIDGISRALLQELVRHRIASYSVKSTPEAFKTSLIMTINARNLRNLLHLRIDKRALKEFQELSKAIADSLPKDHLILFEDILKKMLTFKSNNGMIVV